ncbi:hypothetical protein ACR0ST_08460 [Aliidiomarina sp. Khilg15.8]
MLTKLALLLYPMYVWWVVTYWHPAAAALPVAVGALWLLMRRERGRAMQPVYALTAVLLLGAIVTGQAEHAMLWYPVWVNLALFVLFFTSLLRGTPVVERIAVAMEGPLDERGVRYTRSVTKVWCGFFVVNGALAAAFAGYGDWNYWLLYNGFVAYVLIGLLMIVEWQVRKRVRSTS